METDQELTVPVTQTLSKRLKSAYEDVSPKLRPDAITAFCQFHRITADTFRKKRCGDTTVTEQEIEWMQAYRPNSKPVAA